MPLPPIGRCAKVGFELRVVFEKHPARLAAVGAGFSKATVARPFAPTKAYMSVGRRGRLHRVEASARCRYSKHSLGIPYGKSRRIMERLALVYTVAGVHQRNLLTDGD